MSVLAIEATYAPRLAPIPAYEPPFDDELDRLPDAATPPLPLSLARLRLVPPPVTSRPAKPVDDDVLFGPQRTPTVELPETTPWARQFTQAILEVLDGRRPVAQLARFLSTAVAGTLERRVGVRHRLSAGHTVTTVPTVVRSVHVCEVDNGVAEVAAVVRRGARTVAIALRLEGTDGRWLCTALQM